VEYLKRLLNNLYLVFSCADFKFIDTDPTASALDDINLHNNRKSLIDYYLNQTLDDLNIISAK
jgi:hypothetical protein